MKILFATLLSVVVLCDLLGSHQVLASPTVKSASDTIISNYDFGKWEGDYCFARRPALARFQLRDRYDDFELKKMGVRAETCATNVWYQGGGSFDYSVTAVNLPSGTTYKSVSGRYNGQGNGCSEKRIYFSGNCWPGTPVLRGFSLEYDNARNVDEIRVEVTPHHCYMYVKACLSDRNRDDPFNWWVHYAVVPSSKVLDTGSLGTWYSSAKATTPMDYMIDRYACDGPCNSEAVLTGFKFNQMSGWPNNDMPLDQLEVGVQAFHDDYVAAVVRYHDDNGGDDYDWQVSYALVRE